MDKDKAKQLHSQLEGRTVGKWVVRDLIDNGKSAAVFRASSSSENVALKIFDDELIQRFGDETQIRRIERELELVGHQHENLVKILDGGVDTISGNHYIVMEYLPGENLAKRLPKIQSERIPDLISQLAGAAQFLEGRGFAHRDIKPENIFVDDDGARLVLLDLGVLRPLAGSNLTDLDGVQSFVGTLQYSSPEFLLRQEEDSPLGWRSLSFYQIGGVLHDLIMRRPLFAEFANPYARLVNAVQFKTPEIQSSAVPPYLVELAKFCLLKDWKKRVDLLEWDSFKPQISRSYASDLAKQRVTNRAILAQASLSESSPPTNVDRQETALLSEVLKYLKSAVRTIRSQNDMFPPIRVSAKYPDVKSFGIRFDPSPSFGLSSAVTVVVSVTIIDVSAKIVEARAYAVFGAIDNEQSADEAVIFFRGSFDASTMYASFERCVYDIVDQAQQSSGMTSEANLLILPREG